MVDMTDKLRLLNTVTWSSIVCPLIINSVNVNIIHTEMRGSSGELLLADKALLIPLSLSLERKLNSQRDEMLSWRITFGRDGR